MAKKNKQPKVDANKILESLSRGVKQGTAKKAQENVISPKDRVEYDVSGKTQVPSDELDFEEDLEDEDMEDSDDEEDEETDEQDDEEDEEEQETRKPSVTVHRQKKNKTVQQPSEKQGQPVDKKTLLARLAYAQAGYMAYKHARLMAKFYQAHGIKEVSKEFLAGLAAKQLAYEDMIEDYASSVYLGEIAEYFEPVFKAAKVK